jgi:hypothetical protein
MSRVPSVEPSSTMMTSAVHGEARTWPTTVEIVARSL